MRSETGSRPERNRDSMRSTVFMNIHGGLINLRIAEVY